MGECFVSRFASRPAAHRASIALDKRRYHGAAIHAWAIVCKNAEDRISISERREYENPATVAALIGALAGFAAGPLGAITGAIGGALVGYGANAIEREARVNLLNAISSEVERNNTVLIADVASDDRDALEELMKYCGGTILHTRQSAVSLPGR